MIDRDLSSSEVTINKVVNHLYPCFFGLILMRDEPRGDVEVVESGRLVFVAPRWVAARLADPLLLSHELMAKVAELNRAKKETRFRGYRHELWTDGRKASLYLPSTKKEPKPKLDPSSVPPSDIVAWYLAHIDKLEPDNG